MFEHVDSPARLIKELVRPARLRRAPPAAAAAATPPLDDEAAVLTPL